MFHTFTGSSKRPRNVNLSGQSTNPFASAWSPSSTSVVQQTVSHAQAERQQRQQERDRLKAAKEIQRTWRGHKSRNELRESRRTVLRELYGREPEILAAEERVLAALPLLLLVYRRGHKDDEQILQVVLQDIVADDYSIVISGELSYTRLVGLLHILLRSLGSFSAKHKSESGSLDVEKLHLMLSVLIRLVEIRPDSLTKLLDQYYSALGGLCQNEEIARSQVSSLVERGILQPLSSPSGEDVDLHSYNALAHSLLSMSDILIIEQNIPLFATRLDEARLSSAILDGYTRGTLTVIGQDRLLWLMCHFIHLHQASPQKTQTSLYLEALYQQLSHLSLHVRRLMLLANPDEDDSRPHKEVHKTSEYISRQLQSLIDRDNVNDLLEGLATGIGSGSRELENASLLAGYSLTVIRCFPQDQDAIRVRLYMSKIHLPSGEMPVVKYFWHAMTKTRVFKNILNDVESPKALLQPSSTRGGAESSIDREWRIVLLFLELYTFVLRIMDDEDFFAEKSVQSVVEAASHLQGVAIALEDHQPLTKFLKNVAFSLFYNAADILKKTPTAVVSQRLDAYMGAGPSTPTAKASQRSSAQVYFAGIAGIDFEMLRNTVTTCLRMIYERDSRRPFLPKDHWLMTSRFDMESFMTAVVAEAQRQREIREAPDSDDEGGEGGGDPADMTDAFWPSSRTRLGRLGRHAKIEILRDHQRRAQRERALATVGPRLEILRNMPFVIPFETRVNIFRQFVLMDKHRRRDGNIDADQWRLHMTAFNNGAATMRDALRRHTATIRRTDIFDDALKQFYELADGLKEPIQITFVDKFGEQEAGIDGGGVTKEFLTSVVQVAFHEMDGVPLFVANDQNLLYPNPNAMDQQRELLKGSRVPESSEHYVTAMTDLLRRFEFLGRIVGKCMYEGILVDIAFAGFFLRKWAVAGQSDGGSNIVVNSETSSSGGSKDSGGYRASINDLRDMDDALYQGMLGLKHYPGDVADLDLDFTIVDTCSMPYEAPVKTVTRNLIPNGAGVRVTNETRPLYISYVARHRLDQQPAAQTRAFLRGLGTMVDPSWLAMFNQSELQRLVGGDSGEIDVEDLRSHTEYSGAYSLDNEGHEHPTVVLFWEVMHGLNDDDRRAVLRYVTSTPRAPLLGFASLSPRFSIRDGGQDETRLPSTSTCVNLLKLPQYKTAKTLRKKLIYAVQSGAGFDLS